MEGKQQEKEGKETNQHEQSKATELPDLALTLQSLSLADPGLCTVQSSHVVQRQDLDFSFCLLMKVACTGGTPRNISLQALEEAMERAWRSCYHVISQVSSTVFMAHFRSQEDMISVYSRQPWSMNSDTMLLDWFDTSDNANSSADYSFDTILVTIRAYGIPRNRRSINLLSDILNQVGNASDFHILQENNLFARQDYIWGTAKLKVNCPVKDRVLLSYTDGTTEMAYLFYERIKRICLFCGIMFHSVQHCSIRNRLITEKSKSRQAGENIPIQRFGQWIIDEKYIPAEVFQRTRIGGATGNQTGNPILRRLQNLFAEDPKGKGKIGDELTNWENSHGQGQFSQIAATHTLGQNRPTQSGTVLPQLASPSLHDRHLMLPPPVTQHMGQPHNAEARGIESSTNRREISSTLYQKPPLQPLGPHISDAGETRATVVQDLLHSQKEGLFELQHGPIPGHQNRPALQNQPVVCSDPGRQVGYPHASSSTPDSICQQEHQNKLPLTESSTLQEQHHHHIQQATTASPTGVSMNPHASSFPLTLPTSNPIPTEITLQHPHVFSPHKLQTKRQAPSSIPSSPPLAKRASPQSGAGSHGAPSWAQLQIDVGKPTSSLRPTTNSQAPLNPDASSPSSIAAHHTTNAPPAAGEGILGARPEEGRAKPDLRRAAGNSVQEAEPVVAGHGSDPTAVESRPRRRPSGWDVPGSPQAGAHHSSTMGITRYHHGSATWRRLGGTDDVGYSGPHRRNRSGSLGQMVYPYSASPRRSPARASSGASGEFDPWLLRPISPAWSAGNEDSRQEAFSPPQMV